MILSVKKVAIYFADCTISSVKKGSVQCIVGNT